MTCTLPEGPAPSIRLPPSSRLLAHSLGLGLDTLSSLSSVTSFPEGSSAPILKRSLLSPLLPKFGPLSERQRLGAYPGLGAKVDGDLLSDYLQPTSLASMACFKRGFALLAFGLKPTRRLFAYIMRA